MIFGLTRDTKMLMRFRYKNEVISEGSEGQVKEEEKTVKLLLILFSFQVNILCEGLRSIEKKIKKKEK